MHEPQVADQIHLADVLVGSKADLCDAATLAAFRRWAEGLYPPKLVVTTCGVGGVDAELLLGCITPQSAGDEGQQQQQQQQQAGGVAARLAPTGQRPRGAGREGGVWLSSATPSEAEGLMIRREANDDGAGTSSFGCVQRSALAAWERCACVQDERFVAYICCAAWALLLRRWVLDASFVFDRQRLARLLASLGPRVLRLKGIWRVGQKTWVTLGAQEAGLGGVALAEVAYRRDSRMEVIILSSPEGPEAPPPTAEEDAGLAAGVTAALGDARAGRWQALEGLLLAAVAAGPAT